MCRALFLVMLAGVAGCSSPAGPPGGIESRWVWVKGRIESTPELMALTWGIEVCIVDADANPCGGFTWTEADASFKTFIEVPPELESGAVRVWARTIVGEDWQFRVLEFADVRFLPVASGEPGPDTLRAIFSDETIYTGGTR